VQEPWLVLDAGLKVIAVNEAFLRTFQAVEEQVVGQSVFRAGNGQWEIAGLREMLENVLAEKGPVAGVELAHDSGAGGPRKALLNARMLLRLNEQERMLLLTVEDVTDRRKVEAQLESSQARLIASARLAALGMMAGNVAHEINNPLAIIHASAEDLMERVKEGNVPEEIVARNSERIQQTANRISKVIKSMRHLAREGSQDRFLPAPVAKIVEDALEICRERFKYHSVNLHLPEVDGSLFVSCREVQITQVLLNLLQNGFDAVVELEGEKWVRLEVAPREGLVVFSVSDNGPGVAPELRGADHGAIFHHKSRG